MPASSQGVQIAGLSGCTNIKIKKAGEAAAAAASNKLDASTLDLPDGSNRVYVDGLPDGGAAGVNGVTTTITAVFLGGTSYVAGAEAAIAGATCKVVDVETEYAVGELVKTTVTFVSVPPETAEE